MYNDKTTREERLRGIEKRDEEFETEATIGEIIRDGVLFYLAVGVAVIIYLIIKTA